MSSVRSVLIVRDFFIVVQSKFSFVFGQMKLLASHIFFNEFSIDCKDTVLLVNKSSLFFVINKSNLIQHYILENNVRV